MSERAEPRVARGHRRVYAASVSPSVRAAWMLLPGLAGCLKDNPGFDETTTAGATVGASATAGSTALAPTTDASSSGAPTTSADPQDPSTAPVDATTTATTDATTTSTTTATTTDATTTATTTGGACATDGTCEAVEISGDAYLLCEQTVTWPLARAACEAQCMRLVILDEPENAALYAELVARMTDEDELAAPMLNPVSQPENTRASWWIGGEKQDDVWQWLDGTPMPPPSTGGWSPDNPDINGSFACAALAVWGKAQNDGKWFDRDCEGLTYRFVCEPP